MNEQLLAMMEEISPEERKILSGGGIEQAFYTDDKRFIVDKDKMLEQGKTIAVRRHTRFIAFPQHRHNYIEMMYMCKGSLTQNIEGIAVSMDPGDILLLNQHTTHSIEKTGERDIGINLMILPQFFDTALSMLGKDNIIADFLVSVLSQGKHEGRYLLFKTGGIVQIENVMENIICSVVYGQDDDRINEVLMGILFQYLLKYVTFLDKNSRTNYDEVLLRSALDYIHNNYKNASLTELAQCLNQSVSGLSRLITRGSGKSFRENLQERRFNQASILLAKTDMSVGEIIATVGYENNSYFYRHFKEIYGISPKEYRKKHKAEDRITL